MSKANAVIRVATLIVEGHAPITRVDCSPGLSGRAPPTLRQWFRRQFGNPTLKVTRWRVKHSPGLIEVRGIVAAAPPSQPRQAQPPRPLQLRPPKAKPPIKYATKVRRNRRQAYQEQAIDKRAMPRQPKLAKPGKVPQHRTPAPRQAPQLNHAATAYLLVINHNANGTISGLLWNTLPDQGRPEGNLCKAARALAKSRGVQHSHLLLQNGKPKYTEQVYSLGGKPRERLVVIFTQGLTLPTLEPLNNLNASGFTRSLRAVANQRLQELVALRTQRLQKHAARQAATAQRQARQQLPGWLPGTHLTQASAHA
jgi:hypothetical protein